MLISYILISQVAARYSHADYQVRSSTKTGSDIFAKFLSHWLTVNRFSWFFCQCKVFRSYKAWKNLVFQYSPPYHEVILSSPPVCEEISIPMCERIGYNYTSMQLSPFHHESQKESGLEAHQFYPLINLECSPDLRPFLCSLYTPVTMKNYQKFLPPCRFLCERARAGCEPVMAKNGFQVKTVTQQISVSVI